MQYGERSNLYPLQYGAHNPILRTITTEVTYSNPEVQQVVKALRYLIHEYNGVGLAAPQIGQDMRIIAITERDQKGKKMVKNEPTILLNPSIINHSNNTIVGEEGCLSLPNQYGNVRRFRNVTVQYTTPQGKQKIHKRSGFTSTIVQHEMDHLNGILFIDKTI